MAGEQEKKKALAYTVDLRAGYYRYVNVEGVGECREHFARLVNDLEQEMADVVIVAGVHLLFVDTSPMWMEKFIATVKQRYVTIADAASGKEYDLRKSEDEVAFRAMEKQKPEA